MAVITYTFLLWFAFLLFFALLVPAVGAQSMSEAYDPMSTSHDILVTHYDCTEPTNRRQFALHEVEQCTIGPEDTESVPIEIELYQKSNLKKVTAT